MIRGFRLLEKEEARYSPLFLRLRTLGVALASLVVVLFMSTVSKGLTFTTGKT